MTKLRKYLISCPWLNSQSIWFHAHDYIQTVSSCRKAFCFSFEVQQYKSSALPTSHFSFFYSLSRLSFTLHFKGRRWLGCICDIRCLQELLPWGWNKLQVHHHHTPQLLLQSSMNWLDACFPTPETIILRQYMLHSDSKCFSQCMLHSVNAPLWKYMLHSYIICLHWASTNCSSERVHTYSDSIYRNDLPSITVQDYKNMYFSRQYTPSVRQYICSPTQCTWVHSDNICLQ